MKDQFRRFHISITTWFLCAAGLLQVFLACGTPKRQHLNAQAEQKIEQQLTRLSGARYIDDIVKTRKHVADSVDVRALQVSPLRDRFLHTWLHLYPSDADLLPDAREIILRALKDTTGVARKPLVQAICNALLDDGREEAATILAAYSRGFFIEQGEYSEIAARMLRQIRLTGQTAPPIEGLAATRQTGERIIVFYESDCNNCLPIIDQLIQQHDKLRAQGIQVITISVDTHPEIYSGLADAFPWPDKLCDFRGFDGENPTRWGVSGTPAIYHVDANDIITTYTENIRDSILAIPDVNHDRPTI